MEIVKLDRLKAGQAFLYQGHWMTVADINDIRPQAFSGVPQGVGETMMGDVFGDIFSDLARRQNRTIVCNDLTYRTRVTLPDQAYVERCE